jgi:hypothetical protein
LKVETTIRKADVRKEALPHSRFFKLIQPLKPKNML